MSSRKRKPTHKKPVNTKGHSGRAMPSNVKRVNPAKRKPVKKHVKRPKPKAKFHTGSFIGVIFVIALLVFAGAYFYRFTTRQSIATVTIRDEAVDTQAGIYTGIIIREEMALSSNQGGRVQFIVNDKDRVKKDTDILQIRDDNEAGKVEDSLKSINNTVYDTQNRRGDYSVFYADAKKINDQIQDMVEKNIYKAVGTETSVTYTLKDNIEKNISLRNQMLLTENKGSVGDYAQERSYYENELGNHVKRLSNEKSGIVSYSTDGMEEHYNFENMASLTKEEVKMEPEEIFNSSNQVVEAEQLVCKIVTSNDWYIGSYIDNKTADTLTEGYIKTIYLEQNEAYYPIESSVHKIVGGTEDSYVLFKLTRNIIDYMDLRNISFKLNDTIHNGYKIPLSSIVERTFLKIPNDYILEDNTILKQGVEGKDYSVPISVSRKGSGEDEGYSYVFWDYNKLIPLDTIVNPNNPEDTYVVSETKSLKGVYKANNSIAKFYEISDESSVVSGTYILLDPDKNKNLNVYDKIIAEASNIEENQIIN